MIRMSRRLFTAGALSAAGLTAACDNGLNSRGPSVIDARVAETLSFMERQFPGTRDLKGKASGVLVMPLVTEAGLGLGGSYGRGALQINGITVDYYSATQASFGLQIGAQQFSHVLFFMTDEALQEFRTSPGWSAGANVQYALNQEGQNLSTDTITALSPVVAVIFGQAGLIAGAAIEGTKYNRIIP